MHVCSRTARPSAIFVSCISSQRSFPSRVRSPTPAKHRNPRAAGDPRIQLGRITVLPSPAPPNKPLCRRGQTASAGRSPDAGLEDFGFRRKLRTSAGRDGSPASAASPGPGRPRVAEKVEDAAERALPTGTVTGAPVSTHSAPRINPSVLPRATQRTRPPPRCCCTSPVSSRRTPLCALEIFNRVVDRRQSVLGVFHVERGADHLGNAADIGSLGSAGSCRHGGLWSSLSLARIPAGGTRWVTCSALRRR